MGKDKKPATENPMDKRMKGRQFVTNPAKKGEMNEAYFHPFARLYEQENYDLPSRRQIPRVNAFGTSNPVNRDEFSLNRRAQQQKESVNRELKPLKIKRKYDRSLPPLAEAPKPPKPLYDLVYETAEPDRIKDFDRAVTKMDKDTKNPTAFTNERRFGSYRTTAHDIGYGTSAIFELQNKLLK